MKLAIIIPAYNEENRILRTLTEYDRIFNRTLSNRNCTFIVALNGCTDNTKKIVTDLQKSINSIELIECKQAGKGLAITAGFSHALKGEYDFIGFVDADMATLPDHFNNLIQNIGTYDGIIASRYLPDSQIFPPRPFIKRWGSRLIYEPIIRILFGIYYNDYQCGAKIFKKEVLEKITSHLTVKQWAFDVELLYLCKLFDFKIGQYPTVWFDQTGSKLRLRSGLLMLWQLFLLRMRYTYLWKRLFKL